MGACDDKIHHSLLTTDYSLLTIHHSLLKRGNGFNWFNIFSILPAGIYRINNEQSFKFLQQGCLITGAIYCVFKQGLYERHFLIIRHVTFAVNRIVMPLVIVHIIFPGVFIPCFYEFFFYLWKLRRKIGGFRRVFLQVK